MAQPQLVATGNPASPYMFAKRGLNGDALVLLAVGILGIVIGLVLFFVGQSLGSNPQSLGDLGTSVQLSIVGGVVGSFGLLSFLLWLAVEGIRH